MFQIDRESDQPLYSQIASWLEAQIRSGERRENDRLPSERSLCEMTGASRDTVKRAYRELSRRGCIETGRGSGSYVKKQDFAMKRSEAEALLRPVVKSLLEAGLNRHETELAFLEQLWNRLPESEKLRVAWVDCSIEILRDMARELGQSCNVRVTPFLLEELEADPQRLSAEDFDLIATTINHIDDLQRSLAEKTGRTLEEKMEKVVLAISRPTITLLAQLGEEMEVAAVYESEWYRSNMVRFLDELSVAGKKKMVPLSQAMEYLKRARRLGRRMAVVLPQDPDFRDGMVGELYRYCVEHEMFCILFRQVVDNGSLLHFKRQLQKRWIEKKN